MPSGIVVTDPQSLRDNIAENAEELFCNKAFVGGALATGVASFLLFPPSLAASLPLAAGLGALAHCPSIADPEKIFGGPPPFTGGQCEGVLYRVNFECSQYTDSSGTSTNFYSNQIFSTGPLGVTDNTSEGFQPEGNDGDITVNGDLLYDGFWGLVPNTKVITASRFDGQPDTCGDPPGVPPPQIISNPTTGDTINGDTLVDNRETNFVVPVVINIGSVGGTINLPFSNPQIESLIPLQINARVGDVPLTFRFPPNGGTPEIIPPDESTRERQLDKVIEDLLNIIECVCKPDVEMDMLSLPLMQEVDGQCNDIAINLLASRGTYPSDIAAQFERSRVLAEEGCKAAPVNVPRTKIMEGTGTVGNQVFTSPLLDSAISVVEFEVTQFNENTRLFIAGNQDEKQGRFGNLFPGYFDTDGNFYAMPGLAQYYERNLVIIPEEIKGSMGLRVSVSPGTKFNIWDTGIRLA